MKLLSRVRPSATPWTEAFQAPLSVGFFRQEYWSGVPLPCPSICLHICFYLSWHLSLSLSFRDAVKLFAETSQQIFTYVALATPGSSSHPQSNYWKEGWGHFEAVSSHPLKLGAEVLSGWSRLPPEIKSGSYKHREKGRDGSWVGSQHVCLCTFSMSVFPTEYGSSLPYISYIAARAFPQHEGAYADLWLTDPQLSPRNKPREESI